MFLVRLKINSLAAKFSGDCNESIFSGHTVTLLTIALFLLPKVSDYFKLGIIVYVLFRLSNASRKWYIHVLNGFDSNLQKKL